MTRWGSRPIGPAGRAAPDGTFEAVVLPHFDSAYNLARWLVGDESGAEDVVQDAAVRALRYFPSFRGGDSRAWFMTIVRNLAYTTLATHRGGASGLVDERSQLDSATVEAVPDPGDDPEAALGRRQDLCLLGRALAALPVELRECLVLREFEELSYKEISHIAGVPIGTVMSRLWRARQALLPVVPSETVA